MIKVEPDNLRSDTKATLTCDGSSSNPPAELSWWLDNTLVQSGVTKSTKPLRLYGGATSSIQLTLNVTSDMDGKEFTCQATNTALQRSVHALIKLKVLCKFFHHVQILNHNAFYLYREFSLLKLLFQKIFGPNGRRFV